MRFKILITFLLLCGSLKASSPIYQGVTITTATATTLANGTNSVVISNSGTQLYSGTTPIATSTSSVAYASTSGSASQSGTAAYAARSGTSGYATSAGTSGTAAYAAVSGSASQSGTAGYAVVAPDPNTAYVMAGGTDSSALVGSLTRPFATVNAALTAIASGQRIKIGGGSFLGVTNTANWKDIITIEGSGVPVYSGSNGSHLVGGTVILGPLYSRFDRVTNGLNLFNFGIDCGDPWLTAFNGGVLEDALVLSSVNHANVHDVIVVSSTTPGFTGHAANFQDGDYTTINNLTAIGGGHGIVIKGGSHRNASNLIARGACTFEALTVKSDTNGGTTPTQDINVSNVTIEPLNTPGDTAAGISIVAGGSLLSDINISNFTVRGVAGSGISLTTQNSSSIRNVNISNGTINGVTVGNGITNQLDSGTASVSNVNITDVTVLACATGGIAVTPGMTLTNVRCDGNQTGSGYGYGFGIPSGYAAGVTLVNCEASNNAGAGFRNFDTGTTIPCVGALTGTGNGGGLVSGLFQQPTAPGQILISGSGTGRAWKNLSGPVQLNLDGSTSLSGSARFSNLTVQGNLTFALTHAYNFSTGAFTAEYSGTNNLTNNGATQAAGSTGQGALLSSSSSQYLVALAPFAAGGTNFTVACRFNTPSTAAGGVLLSEHNYIGTNKGWLLTVQAGGILQGTIIGSDGASYNVNFPTTFTANTFHTAVMCYDASGNRVGVSLDGAAMTWATVGASFLSTVQPFSIGCYFAFGMPGGFFNGTIDSVAFFEGVDLAPGDITILHNSGSGQEPPYNDSSFTASVPASMVTGLSSLATAAVGSGLTLTGGTLAAVSTGAATSGTANVLASVSGSASATVSGTGSLNVALSGTGTATSINITAGLAPSGLGGNIVLDSGTGSTANGTVTIGAHSSNVTLGNSANPVTFATGNMQYPNCSYGGVYVYAGLGNSYLISCGGVTLTLSAGIQATWSNVPFAAKGYRLTAAGSYPETIGYGFSTDWTVTPTMGLYAQSASVIELTDGASILTSSTNARDLQLGNLTAYGTITPSGGITGVTNNGNASAGSVGEYVGSSVVAAGITNNTAQNVTSISLTAGDWDVSGVVDFQDTTATVSQSSGGINTTSATVPTDGSEAYSAAQFTGATVTDSVTIPRKRLSLASTTTVYLVGKQAFSAGTATQSGSIMARRVR